MNNMSPSYDPFSQSTSPQSKRNTKKLSLQLSRSNTVSAAELEEVSHGPGSLNHEVRSQNIASLMSPPRLSTRSPKPMFSPGAHLSPSPFPSSTPITSSIPIPSSQHAATSGYHLYRHPSLSRATDGDMSYPQPISRRATLSLAIPTDVEISKSSSGSKPSSTNSIPSFSTSSPITSSPLIPETPRDDKSAYPTSISDKRSSSHSSTSTLRTIPQASQNGDTLKTQTLIRDISSMQISEEGDQSKINAYPDGPACVLPPNLYLYSEPKLDQISEFDLVINVARELAPPLPQVDVPPNTHVSHYEHDGTDYYYVPWTHTSKLCPDLPFLTDLISSNLEQNKKVLIHCQCGVSRSASLVVALFMRMNHVHLNEAYNMLKERAPEISPNMSLIFQLMEWGEIIGVNGQHTDDDKYGNECDDEDVVMNHEQKDDDDDGADEEEDEEEESVASN